MKILPAAIILGLGILAIPCLLVYKVSKFRMSQETLDPSFYLLEFSKIGITSIGGNEIHGWWIPGAEGFAGIVLAPGFGMNRSDALSLATVLHKEGFNILIYGQRGSSASSEKSSTFGLKEVKDMLSILQFIQERPEIDPSRIGIWGVDVGAYAALQAAATVLEVRAIAADNVFESISNFLDIRIDEEFGLENPILQFGCNQVYRLFYMNSGSLSAKEIPVEKLVDRALLFIIGENRKKLGYLTTALYEKMSSEKEIISFKTSRVHLMKEQEFQGYDRQVGDFFLQNLQ
jgi:pimeloyl-ACP methyl ester carboxylesterase